MSYGREYSRQPQRFVEDQYFESSVRNERNVDENELDIRLRRRRQSHFPPSDYNRNTSGPVFVRGNGIESLREPSPISNNRRIEGPIEQRGPDVKRRPRSRSPVRRESVEREREDRQSAVFDRRIIHDEKVRPVDEVFLDLSQNNDVTVHLELGITEDLELHLEEFCRLGRLGKYHAAMQFFHENLRDQMDNPYVFLQYASTLLDMGDYRSIRLLTLPYNKTLSANNVLRKNWASIQLFSMMHTVGLSKDDEQLAERCLLGNRLLLGTTECQVLSLLFHVFDKLNKAPKSVYHGPKTIYQDLLREGRIWDFRDIFIAQNLYFGLERACSMVFDPDDDVLDRITSDWSTDVYDESTTMGLLDLLVSLVLAAPLSSETYLISQRHLNKAGEFIQLIMQNDPNNLNTRQYLRWMIAEVMISSYIRNDTPEPLEVPGLVIAERTLLDLPVQVPVKAGLENPKWAHFCSPSASTDTQRLALATARQLGDYQTEAMCLKLLIIDSQDPTEFFDQLMHLQKTVQGDIEGFLRTCVSRYMVCRDEASRQSLREELLSIVKYDKFEPELAWVRHMILRALAPSESDGEQFLEQARELEGLPTYILDFMKKHDLAKADTAQSTDKTLVRDRRRLNGETTTFAKTALPAKGKALESGRRYRSSSFDSSDDYPPPNRVVGMASHRVAESRKENEMERKHESKKEGGRRVNIETSELDDSPAQTIPDRLPARYASTSKDSNAGHTIDPSIAPLEENAGSITKPSEAPARKLNGKSSDNPETELDKADDDFGWGSFSNKKKKKKGKGAAEDPAETPRTVNPPSTSFEPEPKPNLENVDDEFGWGSFTSKKKKKKGKDAFEDIVESSLTANEPSAFFGPDPKPDLEKVDDDFGWGSFGTKKKKKKGKGAIEDPVKNPSKVNPPSTSFEPDPRLNPEKVQEELRQGPFPNQDKKKNNKVEFGVPVETRENHETKNHQPPTSTDSDHGTAKPHEDSTPSYELSESETAERPKRSDSFVSNWKDPKYPRDEDGPIVGEVIEDSHLHPNKLVSHSAEEGEMRDYKPPAVRVSTEEEELYK
ncbi:uncharacterized protein LY89DRAFT_765587 [Mollisia scopiformis]|uniref:Uncharacterized protein n=1 Tax=Mollisia scopiformis TaxID=149040 RepID=A0A132B7A4_MOLSC|nr:uncharacterized protein LY89DRAFT_765587 [Mollisia scopiformis]KUJ08123.1 hypothetical protein LY89DRAFT_765587 [Mollisia scopiformis]